MQTIDIIAASKLLCVHPNTLAKLIHSGAIPAARIGRAYVMLERDVLDYATAQIVQQTAQRMGGMPVKMRRSTRSAKPE
jgi:excisionase family DNA binding protein